MDMEIAENWHFHIEIFLQQIVEKGVQTVSLVLNMDDGSLEH